MAQVQSTWAAVQSIALRRKSVQDERQDESGALQRRLSSFDLTLIGVGASIGSGIFVIVGAVVQPVGPAIALSFLLAAFGCGLSALSYAELAARVPVSGSVYLYAYVALGECVAVLVGLNLLVDYHVGAALGGLSAANYFQRSLASSFNFTGSLPASLMAVVLLLSVTGVLCVGVEQGLRKANWLLVCGKVSIVLIIIAAGIFKAHAANLKPFAPFGVSPVLSAATACSFSYIGFDAVANAAEESEKPTRDLPIGITASLFVCATLYVTFALTLCALVPFREIHKAAPIADAFGPGRANVPWVGVLVDWGAFIGIITTLLAGMYSQARIYLSLARDGLFFHQFSAVSASFGTPVLAQLLCGGLAITLALFVDLESLVDLLNIGVLSSYAVVSLSVLALRSSDPGATSAWGALVAAVTVFAAGPGGAAIQALGMSDATTATASSCLCLAVLASWLPLLRRSYSKPTTFACPLCPYVPLLGLTANSFMLSQCHWQAWVRLGVTSLLVAGGYGLRVWFVMRERRALPSSSWGLSLHTCEPSTH